MLIYLWEGPYSVPYGGSYLAACGSTQEEARQKILADIKSWTNRQAAKEARAYLTMRDADQQGEVVNLEWSE